MLGGLARLGLLEIAGEARSTAWLLGINVLGSGLLGLLVGTTSQRHARLRLFAGTGVLGGFTTFSAAIAATVALADDGALVTSAGYLGLSLLASVLAAAVGLVLGETFRRRRRAVGLDPSGSPEEAVS